MYMISLPIWYHLPKHFYNLPTLEVIIFLQCQKLNHWQLFKAASTTHTKTNHWPIQLECVEKKIICSNVFLGGVCFRKSPMVEFLMM